ncbi:MAG: D-glycero-beta-D-manno-heptose 1-phosphate adenylyltransferase [Acidobacteriota bacterium]
MRSSREKIRKRETLKNIVKDLQASGQKVVFTNGCFDLLHPGHVRYLQAARSFGDVLVVAINNDDSVRRLKGPGRPILSEQERSEVLAALECVDWVTLFDEPTPGAIIEELLPDVLVKGGDWPLDEIVGRGTVEASGGQVISRKFEEGYSTSDIIGRIRSHLCGRGEA